MALSNYMKERRRQHNINGSCRKKTASIDMEKVFSIYILFIFRTGNPITMKRQNRTSGYQQRQAKKAKDAALNAMKGSLLK